MIYTLYGENFKDIDEEINNILNENKIDNKIVYDISSSSVSDIITECNYSDLFSSLKLVVVYISSFELTKELETDEFTSYINNPNENTILIIKILSKLDERKKLTKLLREKTKCKEFNNIEEKEISSYARNYLKKNGYDINDEALRELTLRINTNTQMLKNELDKLMMYKIETKIIDLEDIKKAVTKYQKENLIFDLTDAIIKKDTRKLFNTYKILMDNGEEPIMLISLISNQIRLILNVKILSEKYTEKEVSDKLKEHPFRVSLAMKSSYSLSKKELYNYLNLLYELDAKIKTGQIEKYKGLETFLLNLID